MSGKQKLLLATCLMPVILVGCLVRKRVVVAPGPHPNRPPLTTTKEDLVHRLHATSDPIESFLMRVNLAPSVGSQFEGVVKDYATIGAYILFQRPDSIRIIGQEPVANGTLFDMVSKGREFRIDIPRKNRFIIGDNEAPPTSKNELENMRPAAFLTALMIDPPDPENDITLLEDDTSAAKSVYILLIIRRDHDQYRLVRNIYFDRYTLQIIRQKTFDPAGRILSETWYSNWKGYAKMSFPSVIDIQRPQENYEVQLTVVNMRMNPSDLTPDKFALAQRPGTQLVYLK